MDVIKLKNCNLGQVGIRSKLGGSFETVKKTAGHLFSQMHPSYKKDK